MGCYPTRRSRLDSRLREVQPFRMRKRETNTHSKALERYSRPEGGERNPAQAVSGTTPSSAEGSPREVGGRFPIVGIGASAGGLEALEQFLRGVPAGSGMAFVVIQHLDPTHKGVMPELLQRATGMKVFQVKDRTRVQPNCVYVIPPNKDMSILH